MDRTYWLSRAAEVVNMRAPVYMIENGVQALPCIGDGRQSGTSGSPSILNASPEAAIGGGLALLRTGDRVRIDLRKGSVNLLISDEEMAERRRELEAQGGYPYPASQTPWQESTRDRRQLEQARAGGGVNISGWRRRWECHAKPLIIKACLSARASR